MRTQQKLIVIGGVAVALGAALLAGLFSGGDHGGLRAGFDPEFLSRADGYPGLSEHYGFAFASAPLQMDSGMMYRALADGAVDVICGFATDGRIPAYDLVVIEDDRHFFPPYHAAPLVRSEITGRHPELRDALLDLAGMLDDGTMQRLNHEVDEGGRRAAEVARSFLEDAGLLDMASPEDGGSGTVRIGGKNFTEQEILGEMMAELIGHRTGLRVDRRLNLGGTMICFNAIQAGDLDLYAEYTGTGLMNILQLEVITDPDEALEVVRREFGERWSLEWLQPFGFSNSYTITMRRSHAEELGIATISDLAEHVHAGSPR